MKAPLRVGLVGAGWVTQHHLSGWARLAEQARVVAIADPDLGAARARADAFGIPRTFASAAEMLEQTPLDAVDVAAPREFHAEAVRLAAARGLATLCQKPLAPTLTEARDLVAAVEGQCRLMVHENWRFRPYYRDFSRWLAEGRIGEVVQGQMTLLSSGLLPDVDGALPALVRQPFIATLERALVIPAGLVDRLTLIGTRGTIVLEGDTLACFGPAASCQTYDMPACYLQSYAAAIAHFVECLNSGAPFETAPRDNLRTLELVEAAYAAGCA